MEQRLMKHIELLIGRYPVLDICKEDIIAAYEVIEEAYKEIINFLLLGMVARQQTLNILLES